MGAGQPLISDGDTPGIVRIGDTVRRPLRPFSLTVQGYLAHLRDAGFAGAPLPLGVDEQGREVLSFVPGDVARWLPREKTAGEDVLVALARLIRALHEASAGWVPPPGAVWGGTPPNAGRITERAELVSHRDYALGNVVFRDGLKWGDPRDRPPALADADIPTGHRCLARISATVYGFPRSCSLFCQMQASSDHEDTFCVIARSPGPAKAHITPLRSA